jgi:hypothetical protein
MGIDWLGALAIGFAAVGDIQYLKGWCKGCPSWVWGVALPVVCVGLAFAPPVVLMGALALGIAQLGYENIVKVVMAKLGIV